MTAATDAHAQSFPGPRCSRRDPQRGEGLVFRGRRNTTQRVSAYLQMLVLPNPLQPPPPPPKQKNKAKTKRNGAYMKVLGSLLGSPGSSAQKWCTDLNQASKSANHLTNLTTVDVLRCRPLKQILALTNHAEDYFHFECSTNSAVVQISSTCTIL